jgi:hypothetical protein
MARIALGIDDAADLTGRRRLVEADDFDGLSRTSRLKLDAVLVEHDAHLAPGIASHNCIALLKGAALNEHGCDGAAANVKTRLDDRTGGRRVGIGRELEHVGLQKQHLEQLIEAGTEIDNQKSTAAGRERAAKTRESFEAATRSAA